MEDTINIDIKNGKYKISIILPVYNSEDTIKETVQTVLEQTYKNIELIIINDGSKDNTDNICIELEKENKNIIRYFKIENSGVSAARTKGIQEAKGEYLTFIDSDDKYENDFIEVLLKNMLQYEVDIVTCGYKTFGLESKEYTYNTNKNYEGKNDQYVIDLQERQLFNSIWNKLYKTEIIKKANINFNKKFDLGEDYIFNLQYMQYVKKAIFISDILYLYRVRDNGLNCKYRKDRFQIEYALVKNLEKFFINNNYDMELVYIEYVKAYFHGIINIFDKNNKETNKQKRKQLNDFISSSDYEKNLKDIRSKLQSKKYKMRLENMINGKFRIYLLIFMYKFKRWSQNLIHKLKK